MIGRVIQLGISTFLSSIGGVENLRECLGYICTLDTKTRRNRLDDEWSTLTIEPRGGTVGATVRRTVSTVLAPSLFLFFCCLFTTVEVSTYGSTLEKLRGRPKSGRVQIELDVRYVTVGHALCVFFSSHRIRCSNYYLAKHKSLSSIRPSVCR